MLEVFTPPQVVADMENFPDVLIWKMDETLIIVNSVDQDVWQAFEQ